MPAEPFDLPVPSAPNKAVVGRRRMLTSTVPDEYPPAGKAVKATLTYRRMKGAPEESVEFMGLADEGQDEAMARLRAAPAYSAADMVLRYQGHDNVTLHGMVNELDRQARNASAGDLSGVEAQLVAQAGTLEAIFNQLARRALRNFDAGYMDAGETFLRLALKAQSQCRSNIEALGQLKNPGAVAFVKQANISAGHQQVNNGSPARETDSRQNKLLEGTHERLDIGATQAAVGGHQAMEALEQVHRPPKSRGKG